MGEDEIVSNPFNEDELEETGTIFRTYRMDFKNKRIIGMVDGAESVAQAAFKALQTRRFSHIIYDDQYGCDVYNKIGNVDISGSYLDSDMPVMVEETFMNDEAIIGIGELTYDIIGRDGVSVSFELYTIFGDADFEGVITDG